jgi:rhomboid family GlyGly-CTERM serine protease
MQSHGGGTGALPLVTAAVAVLAIAIHTVPGAAALLEFRREAVSAGQCWRIFSGHLTHWSVEHLVWDVAAFLILGWLCESRSRLRFALCLVVSAGAGVLVFHLGYPQLQGYRGLSGIDSALFGLASTTMLTVAAQRRDPLLAACGVSATTLFLAKTAYELLAGGFVFVADPAGAMAPVPAVHAAGFLAGLLCALIPRNSVRLHSQPQRGSTLCGSRSFCCNVGGRTSRTSRTA